MHNRSSHDLFYFFNKHKVYVIQRWARYNLTRSSSLRPHEWTNVTEYRSLSHLFNRVKGNRAQRRECGLELRVSLSACLSFHGLERWLAFLHDRSNGLRNVLSARINPGALS